MTRSFLGVERSMLGRSWRERLSAEHAVHALAISQAHGLSDLMARLLAARGQTVATAAGHLAPSLRDLMPDPSLMSGMNEAVERLAAAVVRSDSVTIFGDYDVDGACSAALLADYLGACGLRPDIHIPDRITEGYGPNTPAIEAMARRGAQLLVTVDCGTTSIEPLTAAKRCGLDCVVIDHHQAPLALPTAEAIVNPNRQDDLSGLGHLCAAGVVFMVLVAVHRALRARGFWEGRPMPDLLASLDLVALATVADVVPLVGLNRAFVTKGLAVMRLRARPGLAALFDVAGTNGPPTAFHLGFLIGPRINAGGRIGDAALGARLLVTSDPIEARRIAERLDGLNRERRAIETVAAEEADAMATAALVMSGVDHAVVVTNGEWHPGVVGLVAARLRERHGRPAFAIAVDGPVGTGSGRSITGVDLGRAVREAVEAGLLIKGGGHAMAAGVTIEVSRIDAFQAFLHDRLEQAVLAEQGRDALDIDATLTASAASADIVEGIEAAGPFGSGNPEPTFAFAGHRVAAVLPVGTDHLRVIAESPDGSRLTGVAFRAASGPLGQQLKAAQGAVVHLAGSLTINRWGGTGRAELRIVDAALPR